MQMNSLSLSHLKVGGEELKNLIDNNNNDDDKKPNFE